MSNRGPKIKLKTEDRFKKLLFNTMLFAIGSMGSKLLSLFLLPMVTSTLGTLEAGATQLVVIVCNFVLPIMYVCINEAVIRFGTNGKTAAHDVYTTGISVVFIGFAVTLLFYPLIKSIGFLSDYVGIFYLYILASALRTVSSHFVRSQGHTRIFTIDGILTTLLSIFFTWLFVVNMRLGAKGMLWATVAADGISVVFLNVSSRSMRNFSLQDLDRNVSKEMILYSLPLVPAAISWMITNFSDTFFIEKLVGSDATGIYSFADRVPQLLLLVSTVFIQAWQLSAFEESDHETREEFFTQVFKGYSALVFIAGSVLLLLVRPISAMLLKNEYYQAWQYSTFLIVSVVFSCLVTYLGTIYNVNKKNFMVTVTTIGAAVFDVILNFIMIPIWGIQGATISTFISYFFAFVVRAVNTRKYIKIDFNPVTIGLNTLLLVGQATISIKQPANGIIMQAGILLAILILNIKPIIYILKQVLKSVMKLRNNKG